MKSWCDLSWKEKCDIESGNVTSFDYLCGYDFNVKSKVVVGQEKHQKEDEKK